MKPAHPYTSAPALSSVLRESARHVRAVLDGQSLSRRMDATAAAQRGAVQAITFYTLRRLGLARALHAALVARPQAQAEALLLVALALLDAATRDPATLPPATPIYTAHTIVDQAVRAASQSPRLRAQKGFINAVLRQYLRTHPALHASLRDDSQACWNFPPWWIARVQADYPEHWQDLLAALDPPAPMILRVNRRRQSVAGVLQALQAHGIAAHAVGEFGVQLARAHAVPTLPGFAQGWWSVQDAAAQRAAPLLAPQSGMRILDACAAPGGKTAHLLELADVHVHALDADGARLARVTENLERLGLAGDHVTLACADAARPDTWWDGTPFDAILLDAPCTASGVVRRHPDIRWLRRSEDVEQTVALQTRLLDAVWPLLRPGGRLLYATCSVFVAEGEAQAQACARRWPDALRLDAPGQLLPSPTADGFFYALFSKRA